MMGGFWKWYAAPVARRRTFVLLSGVLIAVGMLATGRFWSGDMTMTALWAALWGFVGTIGAKLMVKWMEK